MSSRISPISSAQASLAKVPSHKHNCKRSLEMQCSRGPKKKGNDGFCLTASSPHSPIPLGTLASMPAACMP